MTNLEKAQDFFRNDIFATEVTGIKLLEVDNNYAKCSLDIEPKHLNAANTVMGGVIFTLADFTFAVAANFNKSLTVTLASQINFLNVPKGKTLFSEAICVKEGGKTVFFLITIQDESGMEIASVNCNGYRK